jgi:hypothetical protein
MNAAAIWFSSSKALLCLWHVNKAVLQHCRPFFASKVGQAIEQAEGKAWDEFYAFWHSIVASPDEKSFEERLAKFELEYVMKRIIVGNVERSKLHTSERSTAPYIVSTSQPSADRTRLSHTVSTLLHSSHVF